MLEASYTSMQDVPEQYRYLYVEQDGQAVLMPQSNLKTVDDVARLQESLRKEREDHKSARSKLGRFGDLDPDQVYSKLDRVAELEAAAGGKLDEDQINKMVETRIKSKTAPLERELQQVAQQRAELEQTVKQYKQKETMTTIGESVRNAAMSAKVRQEAIDDVLMYGQNIFTIDEYGKVVTKDGVGVTPGIEAAVWLTERKAVSPHWWPESRGAGATGSNGVAGGVNPWAKETRNLTEQGRIFRENPEKAKQMAASAGVDLKI